MGRKAVKEVLREYRPANSSAAREKGKIGDNPVAPNLKQQTDAGAEQDSEHAGTETESATVRTDTKAVDETVNVGALLSEVLIKSRRLSKCHEILFWQRLAERATERAKDLESEVPDGMSTGLG